MVQRFVAFIILAIGAVNSCYAFDLDVFQNSNQKPLVLAIMFDNPPTPKPKPPTPKPPTPTPTPKPKNSEAERQAKIETERLAKIEAERLAKIEAERLAKIEADRLAKIEAERLAKIETERLAKIETERLAKIEAERLAKIEAERLAKIEADRLAKIEAERLAKIEAERLAKIAITNPLPLTTFKDCPDCPEMVKIPAGKFMMGSVLGEGKSDEYPQHQVSIREFAVARFEVSFKDWDDCLKDGVCDDGKMTVSWRKEEKQPLNSASWVDAQNYVKWLSRKTSKQYRLLTEAEWEYVARAGTTTQYWWGNSAQPKGIANCDGCGSTQDNRQTAIVSSFNANPFGLYNITGNVFEWVEDCYHENYNNAPVTGAAWSCDNVESYAVKRVLRGGGWSSPIEQVRSASRKKAYPVTQLNDYGIRVARSLP